MMEIIKDVVLRIPEILEIIGEATAVVVATVVGIVAVVGAVAVVGEAWKKRDNKEEDLLK